MKRLFQIALLASLGLSATAQYNNDWINYGQKYFKIKVAEDGIYRVSFNELNTGFAQIGASLSSVKYNQFQVFGRGVEQYIYVQDADGDSLVESGDYIEFFARKNDGWMDSLLYDSVWSQPNPYLSLFNDTATYYLTWTTNVSLSGLRMSEYANTNYSTHTPAPYFMHEKVVGIRSGHYYKTNYFLGEKQPASDKTQPFYTFGEGWFRKQFTDSQKDSVNFPMNYAYTGPGAPNATVKTVVASTNNPSATGNDHEVVVWLGNDPLPVVDDVWAAYGQRKYEFSVAPSTYGVNPFQVRFEQGPLVNSTPDRRALSHVYFKSPRTFDVGGVTSEQIQMILPANGDTTYILASNVSNTADYFYDLTSHARIAATYTGANTEMEVLVETSQEKECWFTTNNAIRSASLTKIGTNGQFVDYAVNEYEFLIVTGDVLQSSALAYQVYRNQDYSTGVYYMNDLYDQFAYGVRGHPFSIRGFAEYILGTWNDAPKYLLLLGKSVSERFWRYDPSIMPENIVPTVGVPSSDNMLTAGLNGTTYEAAIPTGRIAAKNTIQADGYLNKLKEFEDSQDPLVNRYYIPGPTGTNGLDTREWQKQVLHFGGGNNTGEQNLFKYYLGTYADKITDTLYGGNVHPYYKTSAAPIDQNNSEQIEAQIASGVGMMTFFGHAAGSGFDINIDNATDWNNQGRYPVLLANSCYAGDIHQPSGIATSTSEDFVLTPNEGVIAFIASSDLGFAGSLHAYTQYFHDYLSQKSYGSALSELMQKTVQQYQVAVSSPNAVSTVLEMTLHGDPAAKLYPHNKPDMVLDQSRVFFTPANVTADVDSFDINVVITNIGRATATPFTLEVTRRLQDNSVDSIYRVTVPGIGYKDTISITMATRIETAAGLNSFRIWVDPQELASVDEMEDIGNNFIGKDLFITADDIVPVFPYNYSVIPDLNALVLKASTGNPFATSQQYVFEIDTNDAYSSPIKMDTLISQSGGVVKWPIGNGQLITTDSIVYFWRCSPYDPDTSQLRWREHSFQYIDGKNGWGQDHFHQFKNDQYQFIDYRKPQRLFDFQPASVQLQCNVYGNANSQNELFGTEYQLDGIIWDYGVCGGFPAIYLVVIDSLTLDPWGSYVAASNLNPGHSFGNYRDGIGCLTNQPDYYFMFRVSQPTEMNAMVNMLNTIPDGSHVLAYTTKYGLFQDSSVWNNSHFQAFEMLGADSIRFVNDTAPYIFYVQKGDTSSAREVYDNNDPDGFISLSQQLASSATFGNIGSTTIGPAAHWDTLFWETTSLEPPKTEDTTYINVYGIDVGGNRVLKRQLAETNREVYLGDDIDALQYPYIELEMFTQDNLDQTPAQLARWHVLYDGVPEAALNSSQAYELTSAQVQEGETVKFNVAIENISELDMDSLRVSYWVVDKNNNIVPVNYPKQDSLRVAQVLNDQLSINTKGLGGLNQLWVDVNPQDAQWQLEQHHFNNVGVVTFEVEEDKINPLLDVTFDGVHILDGDIVSPKPDITLQLKDENLFLALDDTADFRLYLTDPDGIYSPIYFNSASGQEQLLFTPANLPDNRARIEWSPNFEEDGIYKLTVEARDASNNKAGEWSYQISFEVISKSTITQIMNYPNPFTSSTRFVFTLTGDEVPDIFTIQILTISGKVIREITVDELGPVHTGRNMSEYAWDGTDEFGDRLANGVYLYRVITKMNGQAIEHRESGADTYFTEGFGKMYLMR